MLSNTLHLLAARARRFQGETQKSVVAAMLCIAFVSSLLVSCGSASTAVKLSSSTTPGATVTSTPYQAATATSKPTQVIIPTATSKPQQVQAPISAATQIPAKGAPATLDLRPASMSIIGHLDCQRSGAYVCFARVLSSTSNQSNLNWFASTNVPGHISFNPVSGVLAPGQSVLITITVPFTACTPGLFIFQGPINTHTITWAC